MHFFVFVFKAFFLIMQLGTDNTIVDTGLDSTILIRDCRKQCVTFRQSKM